MTEDKLREIIREELLKERGNPHMGPGRSAEAKYQIQKATHAIGSIDDILFWSNHVWDHWRDDKLIGDNALAALRQAKTLKKKLENMKSGIKTHYGVK